MSEAKMEDARLNIMKEMFNAPAANDPTVGIKFKKVFITGASGFVGTTLIHYLKTNDICQNIVGLARSDRSEQKVKLAGASAVCRGDLSNVDTLAEGMTGCDVVFHVAAELNTWRGMFERSYEVNVIGTENVLNAAKQAGVATFVHCSTEACLVSPERDIVQADETWPYDTKNHGPDLPYTTTKALAETKVRHMAASEHKMKCVILRPRAIWGVNDTVVLQKMVDMVKSGDWKWFGGGKALSSHCHVRNVCEGLILGAANGKNGETYFLTDGPAHRVREFYGKLFVASGVQATESSLSIGLTMFLAGLLSFLYRCCCCCNPHKKPLLTKQEVLLFAKEVTVVDDKARKEIGYTSHVSVEDGIAEIEVETKRRREQAGN